MKLSDLTPNPKNPRKLSQVQKDMMGKSLIKLGDVSGFVFNRRTQRLIAGHQKRALLPPDAFITVVKAYDPPLDNGTVSAGFVDVDGEMFKYREVDVDESTELSMNIASNKHAGSWDIPALTDFLMELDAVNVDMDLLGFTSEELANIMAPINKQTIDDKEETSLQGRFIIEIEFGTEEEMHSLTDTLAKDGYLVRVKNG